MPPSDLGLRSSPFQPRISSSKLSVAFGGIFGGLPELPYAYSGAHFKMHFSPSFIDATPMSNALMTEPWPSVNWNGSLRSRLESNFFPSASSVPPSNGHTYGRSPVCIRTCVRRLKSSENRLPQPSNVHWNGFSPVCTSWWRFSFELSTNDLPHSAQTWTRGPWVCKCLRMAELSRNIFVQPFCGQAILRSDTSDDFPPLLPPSPDRPPTPPPCAPGESMLPDAPPPP
uniref:Uncharacterized protein n=1 Tax=Anopheles atroparvus TaxID=41427 RepID=A0A182IPJ5_ANOAO